MYVDSPPKWKLLKDVLAEIKEECRKSGSSSSADANNDNNDNSDGYYNNHKTILLIVADHFTLKQTQDVITMGVEQVIDQRYRWFISQQAMSIKNRLRDKYMTTTTSSNNSKSYKHSNSSNSTSSSSYPIHSTSSSSYIENPHRGNYPSASHPSSIDINPTIEQMKSLVDAPATTTTTATVNNTMNNNTADINHINQQQQQPSIDVPFETEHLDFDFTSRGFLSLDEENKLILIQVIC